MTEPPLTPLQQALLKKRLAAGSPRSQTTIPRRPASEPAPLSFAQRRFWLLNQIQPDAPLYQRPLILRLRGPLSFETLHAAVDGIVARHAILRTRFPLRDGQPVQEILPAGPVEVAFADISALDDLSRQESLEKAFQEIQSPFHMTAVPPIRWRLVRTGVEEHYLLVGMHHILFDGWSSVVFQRDFSILYAAASQGVAPDLPILPIDYGDFAAWQQAEQARQEHAAALLRWVERFRGDIPVLELPRKRSVVDLPTAAWVACEVLTLPADLAGRLRTFAAKDNATLFMALLAGYLMLLRRYTGQRDVVIGSPVWGRGLVELEGLLGVFINPAPLFFHLPEGGTFHQLLDMVRNTCLECFADAQVPFERIVEAVNPPRSPGRALLFQTLLQLRNLPPPRLAASELRMDEIKLPAVSEYDVAMEVAPQGDALRVELHYLPSALEKSDAAQLLAAYVRLLENALAAPEADIDALSMVGESEGKSLLAMGDGGEPTIQLDILAEIERRAVENPQAEAARCGSERLTRRVLQTQSALLAAALRERGLGNGDRIGLALPRSVLALVGMLGVLKAGAAFVWLEPGYPGERLKYMAQDSKVGLIIVASEFTPDVSFDAPVIAMADLLAEPSPAADVFLPTRLPESPAYCIYTSGSTGQPKGILHGLEGLSNAAADAIRRFQLNATDTILQVSALGYDVALGDVFSALASGARLVIVPADTVRDPTALLACMRAEAITAALSIVPTLLEAVLSHAGQGGLVDSNLRLAVMVGEPPHAALCERFFQTMPASAELYNRYGPSEATQATTIWRVERGDLPASQFPVGCPLPGTRVCILDRGLRLVPQGLPGEVCIGGRHLALAYLNLSELTRDRFVDDPYRPGEKLYRTGDWGYWNPQGELALIGREDFQVKLRGHRVELGEIEAALERHPRVRRAAVVTRADQVGGLRLAAFLVMQPGSAPHVDELRGFLERVLPDHMIPSTFATLDELPTTVNGKVDRQMMQDWRDESALAGKEDTAEGGDEVTYKLTQIWRELLEIPQIPMETSFFDLGGYSMLLIGLMAKVNEAFGVRLSLAAFLDRPTLAEQIRQVRVALPEDNGMLSVLKAGGGGPPLYLAHTIAGVSTAYVPLLPHLSVNCPVIGLEMPAQWLENPPDSIQAMAAVYCQAILERQPVGPYRLCGWSFGGLIALEIAVQLSSMGKQVEPLIVIDTDLSRLAGYERLLTWRGRFAHFARKQWKLVRWVRARLLEKAWAERVAYLLDLGGRVVSRIVRGTRIERKVYAAELPKVVKQNMKLNFDIEDSFQPPHFSGKVVLLRASKRQGVLEPAYLGWAASAKSVRVIDVPGDHNSIMSEPNVRAVGKVLESLLAAPHNAKPLPRQ